MIRQTLIVVLLVGAIAQSALASAVPSFANESFYDKGKFNVEKAKDAVIALMKFHGYPVYPGMKKNLWVSDYGTGQFTKGWFE